MMLLMTGSNHQNDHMNRSPFGAWAVASTGIKPSGSAPVMSALEYNPQWEEQTGRHGGNCTSTTQSLQGWHPSRWTGLWQSGMRDRGRGETRLFGQIGMALHGGCKLLHYALTLALSPSLSLIISTDIRLSWSFHVALLWTEIHDTILPCYLY